MLGSFLFHLQMASTLISQPDQDETNIGSTWRRFHARYWYLNASIPGVHKRWPCVCARCSRLDCWRAHKGDMSSGWRVHPRPSKKSLHMWPPYALLKNTLRVRACVRALSFLWLSTCLPITSSDFLFLLTPDDPYHCWPWWPCRRRAAGYGPGRHMSQCRLFTTDDTAE